METKTPFLLHSSSSSFFASAKDERRKFRALMKLVDVNMRNLENENHVIVGS